MLMDWRESLGSYVERPWFVVLVAMILSLLVSASVVMTDAYWHPLLLIGGPLLVWLVVTRPNLGLAILIFATYTRFSDVLEKYHGIPSFVLPLALLLLGALLWRWWLDGEYFPDWEIPAMLLGAYALVGFASLLYAPEPDRSRYALIVFAKNGLLVFAIFLMLRSRRSLRYTVWALVAAGIFMGTLTVYQQLTGTSENQYWGFAQTKVKNIIGSVADYRAAGPVGSPSFYAMILAALVPVTLDRAWHEKKTGLRLLALWGLIVCLLSVVFTFSRGGFLALVAVLLLMLVRHSFHPTRLILISILLFAVWQFLPNNYTDRLATTLDLLPGSGEDLRNESSFRGRTSEALVAWYVFRDHPVLGVGLNNYKTFYQEYARPLGWDDRREERSAHSLYLETAAETGLVGLAALGVILVVTLMGALRAEKAFLRGGHYDEASMSWALTTSMAGYLVASIFLHGAYPRFFWLLVGVLLALPHVASSTRAVSLARLSGQSSYSPTEA